MGLLHGVKRRDGSYGSGKRSYLSLKSSVQHAAAAKKMLGVVRKEGGGNYIKARWAHILNVVCTSDLHI